MHVVYIDDSGDETLGVFSCFMVPSELWKAHFATVKEFRRDLRKQYGIRMYEEFHATDFVAGRGNISNQIVTKFTRCNIFQQMLALVSGLQNCKIINAVFKHGYDGWAFERILNRINVGMKKWESTAMIFCDQGKEAKYTKLMRKMGIYNPIPSQFGTWENGEETKNIPIDYLIEDPIFKDSAKSYFIQIADFCAYSLLRCEHPLPSKTKYGLDQAFYLLKPILVRQASKDRLGIVRVP
jgi:hypothetical protein